jgi:hypothetical protein
MEVLCDNEDAARGIVGVFEAVTGYLTVTKTPQGKLWNAAALVARQNGNTAIMEGSIPGNLLAENYAKQK